MHCVGALYVVVQAVQLAFGPDSSHISCLDTCDERWLRLALLSCSSALHIRPLRQRSSAPKNDSGAPTLRRKRDTIALALRRVSAPIKSAISAAAVAVLSLLTVGALTAITPPDAVEKASMAPFAWHLFWRRVTRPEAAQAEARLLDLGLGAGRWRRSDTAASAAPDDFVHSVTIDGTGDTVRSPTLVMVHGLANGGGIFTRNLRPLSAAFAKIHAVDWRGAGLSGRPTYEPDDHDSARDFLVDGLEAWRAKEGVDRMVFSAINGRLNISPLRVALPRARGPFGAGGAGGRPSEAAPDPTW